MYKVFKVGSKEEKKFVFRTMLKKLGCNSASLQTRGSRIKSMHQIPLQQND
jgi:hypothetical protein